MEQHVIAVDFHLKYQKVVWLDPPTGEIREADVRHDKMEKVEEFFNQFPSGSLVGMEVSGYSHWFERLMIDKGFDLRIGHPGEVARTRRRRQKNDRKDAHHLLELLLKEDFPTIWRPSPIEREQKMVVRHLVRLSRQKNRWINVLRALVYNYNLQIRPGHLSRVKRREIRSLRMSRRLNDLRDELLERIERLEEAISGLAVEIEEVAQGNPSARRLMTIPGIGSTSGLYIALTLGPVERFDNSKQVVSYAGLDSMESSSDNLHKKRRYGSISKQGDRLLRHLLGQCATVASRHNPELRRFYVRLKHRKPWQVARIAVARKLLVQCFVMLRDGIDYPEFSRRGRKLGLPAAATGLQ